MYFELPQLYFYLLHFKTNINMKVISLERLVINKVIKLIFKIIAPECGKKKRRKERRTGKAERRGSEE